MTDTPVSNAALHTDGLRYAQELYAGGLVDEAISVLEADIELHETMEKLSWLRQMRHDGFFKKPAPSGHDVWPPRAGISEFVWGAIPEITAEALNAGLLARGVMNHGSLIVRGLLDQQTVQELKACVDHAINAYDQLASKQGSSEWFSPLRPCEQNGDVRIARKWVRDGGGVLAGDSPKALFELIRTLKKRAILPVIADYLGEAPALSLKKTTLRRVTPDSKGGWHQDGAFLGQGIRTLNLWIALSDCGIDAPSMDMIPARLDRIVPTGMDGADFGWSVGDKAILGGALGHMPVRLRFCAGDVIFFDEMNLHRTAVDDSMNSVRHAIEAWFFAPSAYPLGQIPILC